MKRLHIDKLIIVEGKYDKARVENIADAPVIAVNGFRVFNDRELRKTIRSLSRNGVIIMTDSDGAGYKIRVFLSEILDGCEIIDVFVPQIPGKERRKEKPSAQGFLGVEGVPDDILYSCLAEFCSGGKKRTDITAAELYELGYTGCAGARERKNALLRHLGVQSGISNKFLLRILNDRFTLNEFRKLNITINKNEVEKNVERK